MQPQFRADPPRQAARRRPHPLTIRLNVRRMDQVQPKKSGHRPVQRPMRLERRLRAGRRVDH